MPFETTFSVAPVKAVVMALSMPVQISLA